VCALWLARHCGYRNRQQPTQPPRQKATLACDRSCGRRAPVRLAPVRLAPVRLVPVRSRCDRSTLLRLTCAHKGAPTVGREERR
jgi:hypothetical protein